MNHNRKEPPQPPQMERKFKLYPYQYVAIPLLMLIPILAILGVFGASTERVDASNADLALSVEYSNRDRYKIRNKTTVEVQNTSGQMLETLSVHFDRGYIERFGDVVFTPDVDRITETDFIINLPDVQPGETRVVLLDLQAEFAGAFEGTVRAEAEGIEPVEVNLSILVYP